MDRITAAARQVADATGRNDTTKSATQRRSKIVFAEQAGIVELPHARSCCTTEACKILLLLLQHVNYFFKRKQSSMMKHHSKTMYITMYAIQGHT